MAKSTILQFLNPTQKSEIVDAKSRARALHGLFSGLERSRCHTAPKLHTWAELFLPDPRRYGGQVSRWRPGAPTQGPPRVIDGRRAAALGSGHDPGSREGGRAAPGLLPSLCPPLLTCSLPHSHVNKLGETRKKNHDIRRKTKRLGKNEESENNLFKSSVLKTNESHPEPALRECPRPHIRWHRTMQIINSLFFVLKKLVFAVCRGEQGTGPGAWGGARWRGGRAVAPQATPEHLALCPQSPVTGPGGPGPAAACSGLQGLCSPGHPHTQTPRHPSGWTLATWKATAPRDLSTLSFSSKLQTFRIKP